MNGRHIFGWAAAALLMLVLGCGPSTDSEMIINVPDDAASTGEVQIVVTKSGIDVGDSKGLSKAQVEQHLATLQSQLKADGCKIHVETDAQKDGLVAVIDALEKLGVSKIAIVTADPGTIAPTASAEWIDPTYDVEQTGKRPRPDVARVTAVGRDGHLVVTITLEGGPAKTLDHEIDGKRSGDTVLELWVDADNDAATGGGPSRLDNATRKIVGYDASVGLMLGFKVRAKESGMETAMHGNVGIDPAELEVLGHSAFVTYRWQRRGDAPETSFDSFKSEAYSTVTETGVVLRLPYDMFGVKPGDTIRLCFNEQHQDTFGAAGFSDDRLLKLK